ncbi:MAG: ribonuclease E/G [Aestuariivirga sp.]
MGSKMLVDATHAEETRVVVVRGNRIEEFDFESAARKQLKGNIYLAKVTRVEPSLQAAFVEYGGNRHGFLAFSEIHPDYYQIPVADRQALLREQEEDDAEEREDDNDHDDNNDEGEPSGEAQALQASEEPQLASEVVDAEDAEDEQPSEEEAASDTDVQAQEAPAIGEAGVGVETVEEDAESQKVESIGAEDALEEVPKRQRRAPRRQYKIQEVIKRRQIILVQVVKEERGNKGAALTTYLSLAGRYCVLMPNTARGGGISRKITDAGDRRRLKEVARDVEVPQGMGVIVRTAGAQRTRPEIKRDFDYLMRLWENVRDLTLHSTAPALVYEEGSLIKRSIRDLYTKDVDEVFVEGEAAYREAKDFMKMLMPSHAKNVKLYKDTRPLFSKHQTETQLDALYSPTVTLPSGGYIVMNQTEALVSVDINSGKATREHNIEDTALKTNLEACDEIARQLRLRDLAGLVVIDFIDMEENRNNRAVERRLKDALKNDRARIQVGRISHFGLMEMSRQRLRPGLLEGSSRPCPHCEGRGIVRSISSCGLSVLRAIEEHLISRKAEHLTVKCTREVAFYVLNEKRDNLLAIEQNYGISVFIVPSDEVKGSQAVIERAGERTVAVRKIQIVPVKLDAYEEDVEEEEIEAEIEAEEETEEVQAESSSEAESTEEGSDSQRGRRRRRGRRGGRRGGRDEPRDKIAGGADGEADSPRQPDEGDDAIRDDAAAPAEADAGAASDEPTEKEGSERGPSRRRDRWGRNRNGRNKNGRNGAEAESNGHAQTHVDTPAEAREPQMERQAAPIIAIQEIVAQPVEPRKWQPPAATVAPTEVAKPKAGWWSKRG